MQSCDYSNGSLRCESLDSEFSNILYDEELRALADNLTSNNIRLARINYNLSPHIKFLGKHYLALVELKNGDMLALPLTKSDTVPLIQTTFNSTALRSLKVPGEQGDKVTTIEFSGKFIDPKVRLDVETQKVAPTLLYIKQHQIPLLDFNINEAVSINANKILIKELASIKNAFKTASNDSFKGSLTSNEKESDLYLRVLVLSDKTIK
jgi:hypothetical protein